MLFVSSSPHRSSFRYLIPGGSAGHFKREGYTFDVGSSMMFGFGEQGTTNLITKCLEAVGKKMATVPDPTQVYYHLPKSAQFPEVWGLYPVSSHNHSSLRKRFLCPVNTARIQWT